jgi:hypothetical protein
MQGMSAGQDQERPARKLKFGKLKFDRVVEDDAEAVVSDGVGDVRCLTATLAGR